MKPVNTGASEYKIRAKRNLGKLGLHTAGPADAITAASYTHRHKGKPCKQALCANSGQGSDCHLNNDRIH